MLVLVLRRLTLAFAAVVVALLAVEVGLRLVMIYNRNYLDQLLVRPPAANGAELNLGDMIRPNADNLIVYDLRPGVRGRFMGSDISINSFGMRDVERATKKPPATFRIVGLGDSHMFGWGVAHEQTFLAILERKLNERNDGHRYEVLNLAVPGYNTVQEVETFARRIEELDPDLVVINWIANDMNIPAFLFEPPSLWTVKKSYLRSFLRRRRALRLGRHVMPLDGFLVPMNPETNQFSLPDDEVPERYRPLVGYDHMMAALRRLGQIANEHRIPVVLLFDWIDYSPRLLQGGVSVAPPPAVQVARAAADAGFMIADPQDRVVEYLTRHRLDSNALWLSSTDGHPNPLRHSLLAEELQSAVTKSGILGGSVR